MPRSVKYTRSRVRAKARARRAPRCSTSCILCEPAAGDADAARETPRSRAAAEVLGQVERHERPGALVGRLLLHPARRPRRSGSAASAARELLDRQRVELLDPHDRGVGRRRARARGRGQVVVDLAGAEQHPAHAAPGPSARCRRAPAGTCPVVKSADRRGRRLEPQHRLRREHDQRPARSATAPASAAGGSSYAGVDGHRDRHVVLGAQLQEPLDAGRRSGRGPGPRSRAAAAARRRALAPLLLAGGDELVDDRLRAVDEVAELRLPQHQRVRAARPSSRTRSPSRRTRDSSES